MRPFPSLLGKPPTGEGIEWGPPASFLLKAAPGREEGSLSYKWGVTSEGVQPIKRGEADAEKGTSRERGAGRGLGSALHYKRDLGVKLPREERREKV